MPQDTIVTVRMPQSLLTALKTHTQDDHFSDTSEQIRSIVRKSCLRHTDPVRQGIAQLQTQMLTRMEENLDQKKNEELLEKLKEIVGGVK